MLQIFCLVKGARLRRALAVAAQLRAGRGGRMYPVAEWAARWQLLRNCGRDVVGRMYRVAEWAARWQLLRNCGRDAVGRYGHTRTCTDEEFWDAFALLRLLVDTVEAPRRRGVEVDPPVRGVWHLA